MTDPVTAPACYRHADRNAGVSCQRCDRPICPSCMITASVGFQCPECVHGSPQAHVARVIRRNLTPWVTYTLLGINVAVFILGMIAESASSRDTITFDYATVPAAIADGEWWRLLTGGFLHASILHIAFNMYALYIIGPPLESVMGKSRFLAMYMACLLGGSAGVMALSGPCQFTVGASGAIFGLFGVLVMLQLSQGINPLQNSLGMVLLINLALTFGIRGISIGGHLGGLATGFATGLVLFGTRTHPVDRNRGSAGTRTATVIAVGVAMLAAALVLARVRSGNGCL